MRLSQILLNLIGNAIKFTERGQVVVRIALAEADDDLVTLRFSVTDTGIGIAPEDQRHIFNSFSQVDGSYSRSYGGSGLGLAICKQLTANFGGKMGVDSIPGEGSTFWFTVRLSKASTQPAQVADELRGVRALVVDDSSLTRNILRHQLSNWGMDCQVAKNGVDALELLQIAVTRDKPFDLVLLDQYLPGMDGIQLAHAIAGEPTLAATRRVMISSFCNIDSGALQAAGVNHYLIKPVRQAKLFRSLVQVLGDEPDTTLVPLTAQQLAERPDANLGLRVLVAEDNPINQLMNQMMLASLGCVVDAVANGREAVTALAHNVYDIVLMDCQMPEMDGFAATAEIRRHEQEDSATQRSIIIAVTANALAGDRERCLAAGMDDYLSKPFERWQLYTMLEKWLPHRCLAPTKEAKKTTLSAAAPTTESSELIDRHALDVIRSVGQNRKTNLLGQLITLYFEHSPQLLQTIQEAIVAGDGLRLQRAAHSLKSSSANLGGQMLAALCKRLEEMGRSNQLDDAGQLFLEVETVYRQLSDALALEEEGSDTKAVVATPAPGPERPLVLIVDDDASVRLMVMRTLEAEGFRVAEADDGPRALTVFQQVKPELVLLDVMMVEMDGFAACAALRELPDGANTPIVMLTGLEDIDSIQQAYQAGATDFITKPINLPLLTHRLQYILRSKYTADELRAREQQIRQLAFYDKVTGLPNRTLLEEFLSRELLKAKREQCTLAVLFLDLDHFKRINDTLGHKAGDELLREVGNRLISCVRRYDYVAAESKGIYDDASGISVARLGGDEFVIVLNDMRQAEDAGMIARRIIKALAQPVFIGNNEVYVAASIGISNYPLDGSEATILLKNADAAMYHAKSRGRNSYQFYTAAINAQLKERLSMENHLRSSVEQGQFTLCYQPKVELKTGRIVGMEALVRWQHPNGEYIPPTKFIPVAEDTGLIVPLGEWVLRTACEQVKAWQQCGLPPLRVSVNLSAVQFQQKDLPRIVAKVLKESGLAPQYLELELTESLLMDNIVSEQLHELSRLNIYLSIDDFGKGYSSLSYLKRFPLDALKIDRSFIDDIETDASDAAIVEATIALGHKIGLKLVAEGVEDVFQLEFLGAQGCDEIQGYLVSKPLSAEQFADYILAQGIVTHNGSDHVHWPSPLGNAKGTILNLV